MTPEQQKVREFHERFDTTVSNAPNFPGADVMFLRCNLIREELQELEGSIFGMNLLMAEGYNEWFGRTADDVMVEIADALGDLLYVVYGTAVSCGIDMEPIFNEIHRSNMTKVPADGKIVYREDGKVIKPDTYDPPRLESILHEQALR